MSIGSPLLFTLAFAADARALLEERWVAYKAAYISEDGRVIDYRNGSITTSEGQAYAVVRALWMDDRAAFDRSLTWTAANLQGGDPGQLPAWKWGESADGWRVLDGEPASDADQLIAWALLGATRKWGDERYAAQARLLIDRIWVEEVEEVAGAPVLLPGRWARGGDTVRLNPSYILPFVWRDFARVDLAHPWEKLLDRGYSLLKACRGATGLAMDWCTLDRASGEVVASPVEGHDAFGFEAMRVPWMLAAEVMWHQEPRARELLGPYQKLLATPPESTRIAGTIRADGKPAVDWEYPGAYGALLPVWSLRRPRAAQRVREVRLDGLLAEHGWGDRDDYYGQNWIWFGLALSQLKEMPA